MTETEQLTEYLRYYDLLLTDESRLQWIKYLHKIASKASNKACERLIRQWIDDEVTAK